MQDRNYRNGKRYKNIFEMRYYKNHYLINHQKKVKNYLLIRYEDLKNNYDDILNFICNKFNLTKKLDNFVKINSYKGQGTKIYQEKPIKLNKKIINQIKNNLSKKQEISIGYNQF